MPTIEIIGLIAAILTTSSFVPQVYKVWREKSVKDISLTMYAVLLIGVVIWIYYGVNIDSLSIISANVVTLVLVISIIIAKLKFK